jgi:aminoglycoside phosphotransferase (APT) family kinase protein
MESPLFATVSNPAFGDDDSLLQVVEAIDVPALVSLSLGVRTRLVQTAPALTCEAIKPPSLGSYNVAYRLVFSDGVQWIMRLPYEDWSDQTREDMERNMDGLRFLSEKTTLPVPVIHDYSSSSNNSIGRPYSILSYLPGIQLSSVWKDKNWMTDEKRLRIFRFLAAAMSQLRFFEFPKIGRFRYDSSSKEYSITSLPDISDPHRLEFTTHGRHGPYETVQDYFLRPISQWIQSTDSLYHMSELALLRMFVTLVFDRAHDRGPFLLHHPDFSYQNILVNDEGDVTGIIDWDGIATAPRELSFARYPSWITRDWDPHAYQYPTENITLMHDSGDDESEGDDISHHTAESDEENDVVLGKSDHTLPVPYAISGPAPTQEALHIEIEPDQKADGRDQSGAATETPTDSTSPNTLKTKREPMYLQASLGDDWTEDSPDTLQQQRAQYLKAYTEVDPDHAQLTRNLHIAEAMEIALISVVNRSGILSKLCGYVFGPAYGKYIRTSYGPGYFHLEKGISEGSWLEELAGHEKVERANKFPRR